MMAAASCKELGLRIRFGTKFITEAGIDEWAGSDGIIVLYPHAVKSTTVPFNPQGCWDWWGYDDPNYALKRGTQASIVYKMVQRVMERSSISLAVASWLQPS